MEICTVDINTRGTTILYSEQKQDITCRKLASQVCHSNKSIFKSVIMSTNSILQKQQYIPVLKHDATIAPWSLLLSILHEFHNSRVNQGTIHTSEAICKVEENIMCFLMIMCLYYILFLWICLGFIILQILLFCVAH